MKILSRELFTTIAAALLTMSFVVVKAQDMGMQNSTNDMPEPELDSMQNSTNDMNDCTPVHATLEEIGASTFSRQLKSRSFDFKYGQFTIFAPSDRLLNDGGLTLTAAGYSDQTIDDVLLFHISADKIEDNITSPSNCGNYLLMLNDKPEDTQERSFTKCEGGESFQIGPGNGSGPMPKIVGTAIPVCDGVIYTIEDALLIPTLPKLTKAPAVSPSAAPVGTLVNGPTMKPVATPTTQTLPPTQAPKPTKAPTRQTSPVAPVPTGAPVVTPTTTPVTTAPTSGANKLLSSSESFVFAVTVVLFLSFF